MKRTYRTFDGENPSTSLGISTPGDPKSTTNSGPSTERKTVFENPVFVDDTGALPPALTQRTHGDNRTNSSGGDNNTNSSAGDNSINSSAGGSNTNSSTGDNNRTEGIDGSTLPNSSDGDNNPTNNTNSAVTSFSDNSSNSERRIPGIVNSSATQPSRNDKNATTELNAFFNLLKANIGTGMLALPQAFFYAGLWLGLVLTPFIAAIAIHCMHLLLQSSRLLSKRINVETLNYEGSMNAAFRTGPPRLRCLAPFMTVATKAFICITQIGFCCVYYEFVSENLFQVIECNEETQSGMSLVDYKLILFLPFILICSATELKIIGYMSITSCSLFVATITIILYYCTRDLAQHPVDALPAFGGWDALPLYFGTVVFAIEGIGCMLPIENRMADPSNFSGTIGVLNTCMAIVTCLYTGIGFFGYLQYSSDVQGAITLNLPSDEILAQAAKLIVSAAVFLSYPIQLYVVAQLFTAIWSRDSDSRNRRLVKNYVVRAVCVAFTLITALALPDVGLFISLVGAVSGAMMCLVLPPIVHLVAVWPEQTPRTFLVAKAIFIVGFGMLGSVVGTVTSIGAIIDFFSDYDGSDQLQCSN